MSIFFKFFKLNVRLIYKKIITVISDVNGINVFRVKSLIDGPDHFDKRFSEKIFGVSVFE